jgi:clan AA aspartic protease (TIGR02281 family)
MQCSLHPDRNSVSACAKCLSFICEECVGQKNPRYCRPCEKKRWLWLRLGLGGLGLGIALLSVIVALNPPLLEDARDILWPSKYGGIRLDVVRLKRALRKERCDRSKIIELVQLLRTAEDWREALQQGEGFETRCGEFAELSEQKFETYQSSSEWKKAALTMHHLIKQQPTNYRYWGHLGLLFESLGDLTQAAVDYEQAIMLDPFLADVPLNLATIYERMGRYCDAAIRLENLWVYYRKVGNAEKVLTHARELFEKGHCESYTRGGKTVIRFLPMAASIGVVANVNRTTNIPFTLDTGASYVTLSEEVAAKSGVNYLEGTPVMISSEKGMTHAILATMDTLRIQNLEATEVPVVVIPDMPDQKSLLGLSFLSRFRSDIDHAKGRLTLETLTPRLITSP